MQSTDMNTVIDVLIDVTSFGINRTLKVNTVFSLMTQPARLYENESGPPGGALITI